MADETKTTEAPAEAPKKKRGRPTKAEMEARKAAEAEATVADNSEQVAPQKKTRTRKTAAKKEEAAPEPEKKKTTRRAKAATKETKEAKETAEAKEAAETVAEVEEKPKRRGRPRKAEAETEAKSTEVKETKETKPDDNSTQGPAEKPAEAETEVAVAAETIESEQNREADQTSDSSEERSPKRSVKADSTQQNQQNSNQTNHSNHNNRNNRNRNRRQRDNRQREYTPSVSREDLEELKLPELREKAAELNIDASGMKKADMVETIYKTLAIAEGFLEVGGILDILQDGYGFLRTDGYLPSEHDVYVGLSTIRRNGLRKGDFVTGQTRPAREGEKFAAIQKVLTINGIPIEEIERRPKFSELTPVFPDERLLMEHGKNTITARVIDLAAPIGKGQRGLIVSPPKAGKTTVLKDIAAAITANNPEAHLMYLGIDERPEEATDMERSIKGEVVSSTFDMPSENHIQVAELVIERAKRLVEQGKDVVILLDSITRLARAYNLAQPASGRVLSGGVDSTALYPPKRFLGAARNIENGGSLTILASALIDTGSKMDEVIFEEFKGTGNMELKLDRYLADRRIFPAIDPVSSGTRKEELLLDSQEAPLIWAVRRILANMNNTERAMDMLIKSLKQTDTNTEFLLRTAKKAQMHQGRTDENFEF
ncbi:transcription termination factor Rho [Adlercreutzia sp. ZJ304]|uniref:transcription termination factor Rho n=1 Tax=Adlercreutzia sp. ZJ304 TaxID=2709791 RepID=UPI001F153FD5|nr:transcription termination factor Rho [Adlercreutzia sp. ZJ304]